MFKKIIKKITAIKETTKNSIDIIMDEKLYSVEETAKILHCKKTTIYTWSYQKRLQVTKCGGKNLYLGKEIKKFLNIVG